MVPPGTYSVAVMILGTPPLGSYARNVMLVK
jgi:hypothetical protein